MKFNIVYLSILVILLMSMVSAVVPNYPQNQSVNIIYTSNCSNLNLTSVSNINETFLINKVMTKNSNTFNYSFSNTQTLGLYTYTFTNTCNECTLNSCKDYFYITPMGEQIAGDNQIIFYSILFIILSASLVFLFLHSLGHFIKLDTDLIDVAYSWGAYFALLAYYALESYYLGNPRIDNITLLAIRIGAFTAFAMPFIAFIVSMITQTLLNNKIKEARGIY